MGGGIIITRVKVALTAAMDPAFYDHMPAVRKDQVDAISAKGPAAWCQEDIDTLTCCLASVC
jgi:hypothetical protein